MIKLQDLTPEVYYKESRDFQFIGRLYDVVLNAVKTNVDMIYDIPASDAAGSKMIDLLALTLGFKARHTYSVNQLAAICSIFPTILRLKGTEEAIHNVVKALLSTEGITKNYGITADIDNPFKWYIIVPLELKDLTLLKDLLEYIIPAGISCEVSRATNEDIGSAETNLKSINELKFGAKTVEESANIVKAEEILATSPDTTSNNPNGYNGTGRTDYSSIINIDTYANGLMVNSTIFDKMNETETTTNIENENSGE